ncbi:MAG: hypothetical protein KGL43_24030 [Burkholderiales bacterium]|nr:hypothetical protein [Burkholderiales bacterium]MDE2397173.1 hypothetical protein [Burkholderiales bacterium]MDE2456668.1 hypothetical protein [Burkholderiales bacterium]
MKLLRCEPQGGKRPAVPDTDESLRCLPAHRARGTDRAMGKRQPARVVVLGCCGHRAELRAMIFGLPTPP